MDPSLARLLGRALRVSVSVSPCPCLSLLSLHVSPHLHFFCPPPLWPAPTSLPTSTNPSLSLCCVFVSYWRCRWHGAEHSSCPLQPSTLPLSGCTHSACSLRGPAVWSCSETQEGGLKVMFWLLEVLSLPFCPPAFSPPFSRCQGKLGLGCPHSAEKGRLSRAYIPRL